MMNRCNRSSAARQSRAYPASRACIRRGVACPACSPSCQHDLRSPATASSAATYAKAAKRGLACADTGADSVHSSPCSFPGQARSPSMSPAVTSCGSCFVTIT